MLNGFETSEDMSALPPLLNPHRPGGTPSEVEERFARDREDREALGYLVYHTLLREGGPGHMVLTRGVPRELKAEEEDARSRAVERVFRYRQKFNPTLGSFSAWSCSVLFNEARRTPSSIEVQTQSIQPLLEQEEQTGSLADVWSLAESPEERLVNRLDAEAKVAILMREASATDRHVFQVMLEQEADEKAVNDVLYAEADDGTSQQAIRTRKCRVVGRARERLQPPPPPPPPPSPPSMRKPRYPSR